MNADELAEHCQQHCGGRKGLCDYLFMDREKCIAGVEHYRCARYAEKRQREELNKSIKMYRRLTPDNWSIFA